MSSNSTSSPVQIPTGSRDYFYRRRRSDSVRTQSSGGGSPPALSPSASPVSAHSEVQTPHMPRAPSPPSPMSASPVLSYFLSPSSPVKSPFGTFPFSKSTAPLFDHEEEQITPTHSHSVSEDSRVPPIQGRQTRSMSMSSGWAPPRLITPSAPSADAGENRGTSVLRRLSLSGFGQPKVSEPFSSAQDGVLKAPCQPKMRDADNSLGLETTSEPRRPRTMGPRLGLDIKTARAPSPMGERMLKGQFDAFH